MNDLTVVFGFSDNKERYSNMAFHLLENFNHTAIPFNPRTDDIKKLPQSFETLTLYVNKEISTKFMQEILSLDFKRVIFNPGTDNDILEKRILEKSCEVIHGCTLVMLKTDQY